MCKPASFVLTKDGVFWSKTSNSHEDIIDENRLASGGVRGPIILRVEIIPPNEDYTLPSAEWAYHVNQDILPGWANSEADEGRTRLALEDWRQWWFATQTAGSKSTQTAGSKSTQTAGDESTQTAGSKSTQTAGSKSTQTAGSKSTQKAGIDTVQITRWYDCGWRVATRIVTAETADKWYYVELGVWRECASEES